MKALSMKSRFFLRNLLLFLIPLTIPLVILGSFSIVISEGYIKDYINKSNSNLLAQTQQNLDLLLNTITPVSLLLDTDSGISLFFDTLFTSDKLEYTDVRTQNLLSAFLSSIALAKPEINSIYVYYPNPKGYFYVTHEGRVSLSSYRDTGWYDSYCSRFAAGANWTLLRPVPQFADGSNSRPLISLLHPLFGARGLVILNLEPRALSSIWNGMSVLPGQEILVLSQEGQLLMANTATPVLAPAELARLAASPDPAQPRSINKTGGLIVSRRADETYGLVFLSLTPEATLYNLPIWLVSLTILLLLVSLMAGLMLTTYLVRLNFAQVQTIMGILDSAEQGRPLPPLPTRVATVYERITHDILSTFIRQNYLKLQLSEKTYRTRLLELETRQNQMNPHFLFNTLKTIYWKTFALSGRPNEACAMIDNLSDILDYALRHPDETVTLGEEIRTCKSYLAIQEIRYAGLFRTTWDCPASLSCTSIPKLLLQPILENAIYHGIREKGQACRIHIRIRAANCRLKISVADNGIGMSPAQLSELRLRLDDPAPSTQHIGLSNTHQRIRLAAGEDWGLRVKSQQGRGTCVRISLPFNPLG